MPLLSRRTVRFSRAWLGSTAPVVEVEETLDRDGVRVPATIARPARGSGPWPGWIVLHGITALGRSHAQLARFTRSLASSGAVAIVPEVPEWRDLALAPHLATPTVLAGIRGLRDSGWADSGPLGVIGFSFGAPHALVATTDPEVAEHVGGSVGFGGYCDIESTFRFMMTGRSGTGDGEPILPDPYGRWVVAANYLTGVPELADHEDVVTALAALATYSGELGTPSWDPVYDQKIEELRTSLEPERRSIFDLFATPGGALPDAEAAQGIAVGLADAARRRDPTLDPLTGLSDVRLPVHLLHGRFDQLIPSEETLKLRDALPGAARASVTITSLFHHSSTDRGALFRTLGEGPRFLTALTHVLNLV